MEINDILRLAGLETEVIVPEPEVIDTRQILIDNVIEYITTEIANIPDNILDQIDINISILMPDIQEIEENSEFDYRTNPVSDLGMKYDTESYKTLGTANIDTRYVPAKSGDNPLTGEFGTEPVKENKFSNYLNIIRNANG